MARCAVLLVAGALAVALPLAACVPPRPPPVVARAAEYASPLRWDTDGPPRAVVVAVHGLKGSPQVFSAPAARWAGEGILTYAWTVRFPEASPDDVADMVRGVAERHPGVPLTLVGESLGASLAVSAVSRDASLPVDALVLSSPAVWPEAASAGVASRLLRLGGRLTGSTTLAYWAKVVGTMDQARRNAAGLGPLPVLVLWGEQDEVVPRRGVDALVGLLGPPAELLVFPDGGHTLFRNTGGEVVADQVGRWMLAHAAPNAPDAAPAGSPAQPGGSQASARWN